MKYGKYVVAVLAIAVLATGGALVASHHAPHKTTASVKVSHHHKEKHVDKKKVSSSSSSSSSSSNIQSSSSVVASSQVASDTSSTAPASQPDTAQSGAQQDNNDYGDANNGQVSDPTLTYYVNTYGESPERYHEDHDGMTQQQAQAATPDTQKTSGELQSEWLQSQGIDPTTGQSQDDDAAN